MSPDFDEIQKAMEDTVRSAFDYFLDRETGETVIISVEIIEKAREILESAYGDDIGDYEDVEVEELPFIPEWMEDEIELVLDIFLYEKKRYSRIPERNSQAGFIVMKNFAEQLKDEALKGTLLKILDGKNAFRNFKDALGPYPKERKLWYGFNAKSAKDEIEAWLSDIRFQRGDELRDDDTSTD